MAQQASSAQHARAHADRPFGRSTETPIGQPCEVGISISTNSGGKYVQMTVDLGQDVFEVLTKGIDDSGNWHVTGNSRDGIFITHGYRPERPGIKLGRYGGAATRHSFSFSPSRVKFAFARRSRAIFRRCRVSPGRLELPPLGPAYWPDVREVDANGRVLMTPKKKKQEPRPAMVPKIETKAEPAPASKTGQLRNYEPRANGSGDTIVTEGRSALEMLNEWLTKTEGARAFVSEDGKKVGVKIELEI